MILNKKQAKALKLNNTIDLRYQIAEDYLVSQDTNTIWKNIRHYIVVAIFAVWGLTIWFALFLYTTKAFASDPMEIQHNNWIRNELQIQQAVRKERIDICKQELEKSWIETKEIYGQDLVIRCATYMTLIYSYESNYWVSNMCKEQKNCYGMKWNNINHPAWFIWFETERHWNEWFANRYYKFHYKKKISNFVYDWSMTDREAYIDFLKSNYDKVYWELREIY